MKYYTSDLEQFLDDIFEELGLTEDTEKNKTMTKDFLEFLKGDNTDVHLYEDSDEDSDMDNEAEDSLELQHYNLVNRGAKEPVLINGMEVSTVFSQERMTKLVSDIEDLGLSVSPFNLGGKDTLMILSQGTPVMSFNLKDFDSDVKMASSLTNILATAESEKEYIKNTLENKPTPATTPRDRAKDSNDSDWLKDTLSPDSEKQAQKDTSKDSLYDLVHQFALAKVCKRDNLSIREYEALPANCLTKDKLDRGADKLASDNKFKDQVINTILESLTFLS